jgi:uncharacterized membrane protein
MHAVRKAGVYSYRAVTSLCLLGFGILWVQQGPMPSTLALGFIGFTLALVATAYDKLT